MKYQEFKYNVDVVFCVDVAQSMGSYLQDIKQNILNFYQMFFDHMEENDKEIAQFRAKVITFRNYKYDDEPMTESHFFILPDQNDEFKVFVNGIEARGGGDGPKNALEAIALALKSDWTTGGDRRRHVILLFSDASALPLGECTSIKSYPEGMPADFAQLGAWWEGVDPSFNGTYQAKAGRLIVFAPNTEPWNEMCCWNRYWPAFSPVGGKLDVDISAIFSLPG